MDLGTEPRLPLTLHPPRLRRAAQIAFVGLLIAAVLAYGIARARPAVIFGGFVAALIGVPGLIALAATLVPRWGYLRLDEKGFTERVVWSLTFVPWSKVARVDARQEGLLRTGVYWTFVTPPPLPAPGEYPYDVKPVTGGRVREVYDMKAEDLAALMQRLADEYRANNRT